MKKWSMSAVFSDLFSSSPRGSSTSSMLMIEPSESSGARAGFAFLGFGAVSGASSEVVGETTMTLSNEKLLRSRERELREGRFNDMRACEESAAIDGASSVSVGGGGEDSGKGVEAGSGGINAEDAMALRCEVSSSSPTLSAVSLEEGMIFREGRVIA